MKTDSIFNFRKQQTEAGLPFHTYKIHSFKHSVQLTYNVLKITLKRRHDPIKNIQILQYHIMCSLSMIGKQM